MSLNIHSVHYVFSELSRVFVMKLNIETHRRGLSNMEGKQRDTQRRRGIKGKRPERVAGGSRGIRCVYR